MSEGELVHRPSDHSRCMGLAISMREIAVQRQVRIVRASGLRKGGILSLVIMKIGHRAIDPQERSGELFPRNFSAQMLQDVQEGQFAVVGG